METHITEQDTFLWEWRVNWIGICALLRASIHLIGQDAKACHNAAVAKELRVEWKNIAGERENHPIYWEFINKERNAILKEYQWMAYKEFLDTDGKPVTGASLVGLVLSGASSELLIGKGHYKGQPCIEVAKEASKWVHSRIEAAVERAGFSLEEQVHFLDWSKKPKLDTSETLLGQARNVPEGEE